MNKSVVIVTHVFSPGTSQALRDYLENKADVLFIGHPLFGNLFTWTMGVFDTIYQVIKSRKTFDLYVGSNNLNSFVGIVLKRMGMVKKVIFYTPDSPPDRFKNRILNSIYRWMDYYCIKHCDLVWNNSPAMAAEREKRGVPSEYKTKQIDVPMGTDIIEQVPFGRINRYEIGFVGHLKEGMGLELLIDAFRQINRRLPESRLLIIGGGPLEQKLKSMARGLSVEFAGLMDDLSLVYKRLTMCAIAVAPYEDNSNVRFTDPGKVKLYLSCGLPIIITRVPQVAEEIDREKSGIAINVDANELAEAAIKLLSDETLLRTCRDNARALAGKYRWDRIFEKALAGFL